MSRKINDAGLTLLKKFEGCRLESYQDVGGIWTIGYGETENVKEGQTISPAQAEALLLNHLTKFEDGVTALVKSPISENQFSALVCFAYNVGLHNLKDSTVLARINENDEFSGSAAANWLLVWDRVHGKEIEGLRRRREAERELFLTPDA